MKTLVTGSLAFDTILVFEDKFDNHILQDQIHILNVCFVTSAMQRHRGGCAGNIGYSLKMLGGDPVLMGTVGSDFEEYLAYLKGLDIDTSYVKVIDDEFTAQCTIVTDHNNNQITAFHPGAMNSAHENKISDAQDIQLGIVAPDGRQGMIEHAQGFAEAGIPFMFDPGQNIGLYNADELNTFCEQSTYLVFNDYESQLLMDKTGKTLSEIAETCEALIITKGSRGSEIHTNGEVIEIPCASVSKIVDPTGCGDSYRAGILYGLANNLDWKTTGQIASLCGAIKIEHSGTQNHSFTRDEFAQRYQDNFSESLNW